MVVIIYIGIFIIQSLACECLHKISEFHCTQCSEGCFLQLQDNTETGIPSLVCSQSANALENCEASDSSVCIRCKAGYRLNGNLCDKCREGCNYCNSTHCYQCGKKEDGTQLYLSTDEKSCVDCSLSENDEACGRCPAGKYFDIQNKVCTECMENCALCTDQYNCYQCNNYKLLEKNDGTEKNPDKCISINNCADLKEDHCERCNDGYRLEAGNCVECSSHCKVCYKDNNDNQNHCTQCEKDFVLYKGKCSKKDAIFCEEGSDTYGCLQCMRGYFFNSNLECEKCSPECGSCVSEATHCLSCADDYYFDNTACVKKDDNCALADQAGCKECKNDLSAEGQKTRGYYVPTGKQRCEECAEHCKLCEGKANHCTACTTNYTLKRVSGDELDEEHSECEYMDGNCVSTEMGYCTECKPGYFISSESSSQQCISCHKSCATCKNSNSCLSCNNDYFLPKDFNNDKNESLCRPKSDINMTCQADANGCTTCNDGYWINLDDESAYNCSLCPSECETCQYSSASQMPICTSCPSDKEYVKNGKCAPCNELKHCATCSGDKCATCEDGYKLDAGSMSCSKTNWALIIPLVIVAVIIIVILLLVLIGIIWWRRSRSVKAETAAIKPFHVSSDLELILLEADNEKFPLKTDKWELTFNLAKSKAIVDQEYEESVNLANMSKKEYYFEFHYTPSHRYDLEINPKSATLKPGTAIQVTFKIKMLCTASVSDNIGISAMDVDDQNKETAKFNITIESDLSLKLDHTELKPIMPPIGEGAFGMVFRGTYRGREVAIKKMKARNLTQEQEKEFNHEVSMMTQLRQNCVVELIGAVYTEGEIAIVTEFAEYGSLSKIWGKQVISYQLKVKILDDMAVALSYLHQNSIIHRDVKGENLLVFSLNPRSPVCAKLTDFGTCRNISERNLSAKELSQGIGTPTYMAPECLQNSTDYSYPVDVYAYGIVLYETYVEHNAYDGDERFNQPWMIPQFVIEGNRLEKPDGIPENYWELTTKCWSQNPEDRPKFVDILTIIESWGEDIRYALNVEGEKKMNGSDISSNSTPSVPSSVQEQSVPSEEQQTDPLQQNSQNDSIHNPSQPEKNQPVALSSSSSSSSSE
ncbi:tyrosine kinase putative [Entamoeba histolytica]|uniref:Tyrosine kinase, putative n=3 Tax=Entamoeba histolytica TaxID=5759 RepID=C4M455_ENTH1|nr:tyrosine kinase, putative [Entamoeba histolytica HM-1:IMSS]EAL44430.1 tyrosine kinase, putative [Entamoeba histolytica HM-1:IMSS]GAT96132.1 tyrosine kinase putative [Entamoeba histolytica]|eukprot:XP_649817.1 tyrosine kinase, putative [Entamoeba histolytica HM-1:IMSS]